jgi:hypothetical protein
MNKSDKIITAVAVVLTLLFTYLILPTEVGVKLNVDGDVPSDFVYELPTAESHQIETTVPPATVPQPTAPQVTTPAEDNKAESNSDKPESVKEIIDQYTLLVDKFKEEKPAYTKKEYQALPEEYRNFSDVINKFLGIASNYMVTEEQAEELIREKGAAEILTDVPIHNSEKGCALTDYDAVEWAKCEDLGDGTYEITFSLKEEINAEPTPADTLVPPSAHGAVMQPVAFKDIKAEVDEVVGAIPGVNLNGFDLIYRDCVFGCVYDPKTDQVKSITHNIVIDITADAELFSAKIDGTARLTNDMLIYNINW